MDYEHAQKIDQWNWFHFDAEKKKRTANESRRYMSMMNGDNSVTFRQKYLTCYASKVFLTNYNFCISPVLN